MIKPLFLKITKKISVFFLISSLFFLNFYLISPNSASAADIPGPIKSVPGGDLEPGESLNITFRIPYQQALLAQPADIMLVLDNSGSMEADFEGCYPLSIGCTFISPEKIDSAKEALLNFISRANPTFDQIGLTTFRAIPTEVLTPQTLTTDFSGGLLETAISGVVVDPGGGTSIGNGVLEAWVELNSGRARPEARKYMILATDGLQRDLRSIYTNVTILDEAGVPVTHTVLEWLELSGVKVFSIAVGAAATADLQSGASCKDEIPFNFLSDLPIVPVGADDYCPTAIDTGEKYLQDLSCRTNRDPVAPGDLPEGGGVPNWPRNCTDPTQSDPDLPGFNNYFFAPDDGDLDDVYEQIQDLIGRDLFMGLIDQLNSDIFEPLPGGFDSIVDQDPDPLVFKPIKEVDHGAPCDGPGTAIDPPSFSFDPHFTNPVPPLLVDVIAMTFGVIPNGFDYCITITATVKLGATISADQEVDTTDISGFPSPFDDPGFGQACYGIALDLLGNIQPLIPCSPIPKVDIVSPFEPWIQTEGGDVGVAGKIDVARDPSVPPGGINNTEYLWTMGGFTFVDQGFESAREWFIAGYTPDSRLEQSVSIYDSLESLYSNRGIGDFENNASQGLLKDDDIRDAVNISPTDSNIFNFTSTSASANRFNTTFSYSDDPAVIFINGDLEIRSNVSIAAGTGLVFIVNGNIAVDDSVTEVDGVYIATGTFESGGSSNQLTLNGSMIVFGDVDLDPGRNFGTASCAGNCNRDDPGERFIYEPKYLYLLRDIAGIAVETFKELAP